MCLRWQRFLSFSVFLAWIVVDRGSATPAQHVFTVDETSAGVFKILPSYLEKDGYVTVTMICAMHGGVTNSDRWTGTIGVSWVLKQLDCMEEVYDDTEDPDLELLSHAVKGGTPGAPGGNGRVLYGQSSVYQEYTCGTTSVPIPISLNDESGDGYYKLVVPTDKTTVANMSIEGERIPHDVKDDKTPSRVVQSWQAGMYHFAIALSTTNQTSRYQTRVRVGLHNPYGLLSAIDWPLMPFNVVFAFLYLILSTVWLVVWARSQRHTRAIHVAIGVIAVIGALGHVMGFFELTTLNSRGEEVSAMLWFTRLATGVQLSLMSLLLMVVAVGYGITEPKLQRPQLIMMVLLASLQLLADLIWYILMDEHLQLQYSVPVFAKIMLFMKVTIKVVVAGWVMLASIFTFHHIRVGKHSNKMRTFLSFMVACTATFIAQVIIFGVSMNWMQSCRKNWRSEWLITSFGNMTSFILLIVLMFLWRPMDFAQTYAFSPLSLEDDDDGDLEDEDDFSPDEDSAKEKIKLEPL